MRFNLIVVLGVLAMTSCQNNTTVSKKYFDIDSLINQQLRYLEKTEASLSKMASIDSATDRSNFKPDSTSWANELEVFLHLDVINKPIYVGAYEVMDGEKDTNSNLTIRSFVANREVPVKSLKLYYQGSPKKLRKLEAVLSEQNSLYYTSRKFSMEFEDVNGQAVISRYDVRGTQKMILRDSVKFSISSKIIY
ncbi:MAG TPA: hypothetical protein PKN99_03570 [Cyclobacteriaceae bacterium]|jgi:hypothetical protein|nr:hypothetical protein [Cyclobacteriaceae bacterium]HNP06676.1 hypothetical protein [Cyclobacteriaceae bacterium]